MYMKGSENMTELKEIIAKNLKKYRRLAKLSQVELAYKLHIRSSSISNWENGHNSIDIDTLFKVCKILGVPINKMIDPEDNIELQADYVVKADNETEVFLETLRRLPKHELAQLMDYYEFLMSRRSSDSENPSD